MKPYVIIFVVLLAKSVNGQDCPTKTELETESGYPNIFQINSTAVSVDWSELWPSLDWTSSCVEGLEKRKLWNFIVFQVKFNRYLYPNEPLQRIS